MKGDGLYKGMTINWFKARQYAKVGLVLVILVIVGFLIQKYRLAGDQSILLITSLIAISPVVFAGVLNEVRKPHVVLSKVEIVDFPKHVYDLKDDFASNFNNAVVVRCYLENIGFKTAKYCECNLKEETINEKFFARWSVGGSHPISIDLSPSEMQFVDVLWYDYQLDRIQTPLRIKMPDDYGGGYRKETPAKLQNITGGDFRLRIRASNMDEREDPVSILNCRDQTLKNTILDSKENNQFVDYLLERGEDYALAYRMPNQWCIQVPENLDLEELHGAGHIGEMLFEDGVLKPLDGFEIRRN